ncbi:hypothetical protein JI752_009565 [Lysobacter sp. MMG2]|uniref:hypothetical protein n=1 Tax=Lysobacter sp. MMG2 TaxID=2801338 RepID=UPI001C23FB4B|nr:hypothetical protein [Lysobacter sp. MMG2]MBU8976384.1 hypothetical protein [Lysobacter sp. MMG2]
MHRLAHLVDGQWVAHSYPPVFIAADRIVAGVPHGDPRMFAQLIECMEAPYYLLYVLHTPRGEAEAGRYQSPALSLCDINEFLTRFVPFLSADARFDLWAHSPGSEGTLVWDRHNQLFGYGPVDRFSSKLTSLGFFDGTPEVPVPHQHHYRAEFDSLAKEVMTAFEWSYSPLRPEDEQ